MIAFLLYFQEYTKRFFLSKRTDNIHVSFKTSNNNEVIFFLPFSNS
jgi:hypothetical protein